MRVISGKYKGRKIITDFKNSYRPTLSRIREDVFNLLSHNKNISLNLNNVIFCDLFAGTGSIGIEALSRGVKKVIFNDIEKNNTNKIKEFLNSAKEVNYEIFNINPYLQEIDILNNCEIIYMDPPYNHSFDIIKSKILNKIKSNILIILENSQITNIDNLILKKNYKNKNLFFFKT